MKKWVLGIGLNDKEEFSRSQIQRGEVFKDRGTLMSQRRQYKNPEWFEKCRNFSVARVFYGP